MFRDEHEDQMTVKVGVYCRVACVEPGQEGVAVQAQAAAARRWCEHHLAGRPHQIELFADEGYAGTLGWQPRVAKRKYRPGLACLVDHLRTGEIDVLVVSSQNRLFRSMPLWVKFATEVLGRSRVRLVSLREGVDATAAEVVAQTAFPMQVARAAAAVVTAARAD